MSRLQFENNDKIATLLVKIALRGVLPSEQFDGSGENFVGTWIFALWSFVEDGIVRGNAVGTGTAAEDSDDGESRAEYLNPNCLVVTHYRGDAASEVEEHFQRALAHDKLKENIPPMSMRNFPASFWNSQHPGDVYEYSTDPWHPHYSQYHHRAVHEYHHHNMAAVTSYGGLLLGGARGLGHHTSHHAAHHAHPAASYKDWPSATPSQSLVDASSAPPYPHGPYAPLSGEYRHEPYLLTLDFVRSVRRVKNARQSFSD
ncbi:Protein vestigial [Habropoda laboriosa]|uniref:Protein vestigial n=1 Tax=Habropoda laboriosa TaxID=597456 RepID=A0A0L7R073_9HYME|nr:Protein vestigial [Habropoda laboriosa]